MIRWGWKQPPLLGIAFTNDYDSLTEGIRNSPCCLPSINNHNLSQIVMHGKKRSILIATPSWGDVYIASRSGTTVLELFWAGHRVLNANERKAGSAWLRAEGWFAYASGVIGDADREILKLIEEA
jgi:hypothetical protein